MKTSTEYKEGYELGIADCEHAIKFGCCSVLVQHLKHWEGYTAQDDEDKGYIQALKDFEDKLFTVGEE